MSKRIKIISKDVEFAESLSGFLQGQGAIPILTSHMPGLHPTEFTVADDFPIDCYEGIAEAPDPAAIEQSFARELAWIRAYTGNFEFYVSLKRQLAQKGSLSPKQMASLTKAVERDAAKAAAPAKVFSIEAGTTIVLTKFLAKEIARKAGRTRPHYAFLITEVQNETEKAFLVKVRMTASRTVHCCVCGLTLTNKVSRAIGIGPICADNNGITYDDSALASLAPKLEVVEVVTWIPKRAIKERVNPDGTTWVRPKQRDLEDQLEPEIQDQQELMDRETAWETYGERLVGA